MARIRPNVVRALAAGAVLASTTLTLMPTAWAAGERAGSVEMVDAGRRSQSIDEVDNRSLFSLRLPSGASCNGDSRNDDYRVQSFIVPESVEPAALRWALTGPEGPRTDQKWALYSDTAQPWANSPTLPNDEPGKPGMIDLLPPFTFGVGFTLAELPEGTYRMGIACTPMPAWTVETYWDTVVEVVADLDGEPGDFVVRALADPAGSSSDSGNGGSAGRWVLVGGVALGAVAVVVLLSRRASSRPSSSPSPKEPSR